MGVLTLSSAKVLLMNHEDIEKSEREERYRVSQDDVAIIRKEVNKLTQVVGDLKFSGQGSISCFKRKRIWR